MDNRTYSSDLNIANDEIIVLNEEKEQRIAELKTAYLEISIHTHKQGTRAAELAIANIELVFQNQEKQVRALELLVVNADLVFQIQEKEKRTAELSLANIKLQKAEEAVRTLNAELDQRAFEKAERHKEAEILISKNEHRFRALIENSVDMKTLATFDGKVFYASPAVTKILGYTINEFQSTSVSEMIHPDDKPAVFENLQKILRIPGSTFHSQHRLRHNDGTYIWCEGTISNMLHEPEVNAIVSNLRDISEKKITEQLQDFCSSNLTALINNTNDLMWSVNKEFELITSNKSFDELVYLLSSNTIEATVGKNVLELGFPEEQSQRYRKYYERAFSGEAFTKIEYTNNGFEYWSEISFNPIKNGKEIIGTACHSHNITDIKISERQIKESEARLKEAQALSHISNWELDLVTNINTWSDEFYNINGISRTEITPSLKAFLSIFHPDDRELAKASLKKSLQTFEGGAFKARIKNKNGNIRYVFIEWRFEFDRKSKPIRLYGILQDITDKTIAEEEREQLIEDMIARNRDLEQFTFIISHNLRAPTANIIGLTGMLMDETLPAPVQKEFVQALSTSALGLDSVIKDINSILQVKNEVSEKKELIIFSQLVEEIIISNSNLINSRQVLIEPDFSEVDDIFSLKVYLHSIFCNLINNSIKYSKANVQPLIEIKSKKEKGKIIITFKDNGIGIDVKATGDKLFGLYKRFHTHVEGKGMGLFMVKTQVEAIGGTITVASEVDKGTEFTIILPV